MSGSKAPDFDAYGLLRATHSHNPVSYTHLKKKSETNKQKRRGKMAEYTTQMDAARKGIITEQMKIVAEKEFMPVEKLRELVAEGKVAICRCV